MALGCNSPSYFDGQEQVDVSDEYAKLGTGPGYCHHCQTGLCPVGVTTQIPELERRLQPEWGARRLKNYLQTLTMELTTLARACGNPTSTTWSGKTWWRSRWKRLPWPNSPWPEPTGSRGDLQ